MGFDQIKKNTDSSENGMVASQTKHTQENNASREGPKSHSSKDTQSSGLGRMPSLTPEEIEMLKAAAEADRGSTSSNSQDLPTPPNQEISSNSAFKASPQEVSEEGSSTSELVSKASKSKTKKRSKSKIKTSKSKTKKKSKKSSTQSQQETPPSLEQSLGPSSALPCPPHRPTPQISESERHERFLRQFGTHWRKSIAMNGTPYWYNIKTRVRSWVEPVQWKLAQMEYSVQGSKSTQAAATRAFLCNFPPSHFDASIYGHLDLNFPEDVPQLDSSSVQVIFIPDITPSSSPSELLYCFRHTLVEALRIHLTPQNDQFFLKSTPSAVVPNLHGSHWLPNCLIKERDIIFQLAYYWDIIPFSVPDEIGHLVSEIDESLSTLAASKTDASAFNPVPNRNTPERLLDYYRKSPYFSDTNLSENIRFSLLSLLLAAMKNEQKIILISHGFGSVIAQDCLWMLCRDPRFSQYADNRIDLFLSLGSPVSDPIIQKQLLCNRYPYSVHTKYISNVTKWIEFSAKGDSASLATNQQLKAMQALGLLDEFVEYSDLPYSWQSATCEPHSLYNYLIQKPLAEELYNLFAECTIDNDDDDDDVEEDQEELDTTLHEEDVYEEAF